tara:strand:+ start:15142 stop:16389 length:1248 start_codon:yes stop_codon:yes gene_type:complete
MSFFRVNCDCSCQESDVTCADYTCPRQIEVSYTFPAATVSTTEGGNPPANCNTTLKSVSGDLTLFSDLSPCDWRGTKTEECVEDVYCIPNITDNPFDVSCWNGTAVWQGATCGDQWSEPQVIENWEWGGGTLGDCDCVTQDGVCQDDGFCAKERNASYLRLTILGSKGAADLLYFCGCGLISQECGCPPPDGTDINHCAGVCSDCAEFISVYYVGAIQSKTTSALRYYGNSDNDLLNGWFLFVGRSMISGFVGRHQGCSGDWGTQVYSFPYQEYGDDTCCPNTKSIAWQDYPNPSHQHPQCAPHIQGTLSDPYFSCLAYWGEDNPYVQAYFEPSHPLHGFSSFGTWFALPKRIVDCQDLDGITINTRGVEIARRYCPYPHVNPPAGSGRVVGGGGNSSNLYAHEGFEITNWSISI